MTMGYSESGQPQPSHQENNSLETEENNQCKDYVQQRRAHYNLTSDQTLMMAFAWVHPQYICLGFDYKNRFLCSSRFQRNLPFTYFFKIEKIIIN